MKRVLEFFKSKKLRAFLIGVATLVLTDLIGLDEAAASRIVDLVIVYLPIQGAVDLGLVIKGKKNE